VSQGLVYWYNANDSTVFNVRLMNSSSNLLLLDGNSSHGGAAVKLSHIFGRTAGSQGLMTTNAATDTQFVACDVGSCTGAAYYLGAPNNEMTGCIGWGSGNGVYVGQIVNWISGCRFDTNEFEGAAIVGDWTTVSGCLFYNNSNAGADTHPHVTVQAKHTTIVGGQCLDGVTAVGPGPGSNQASCAIALGAHAAATIVGVDVAGVVAASITGVVAGDIVLGCQGY
jgi:hypothetical protein